MTSFGSRGSLLASPNKSSRGREAMRSPLTFLLVVLVASSLHGCAIRDDSSASKMPVPEDALDISGFSSRTAKDRPGNLQCQFTRDADGQDLVKCTMWEYTFVPDDVVCTNPGSPLTYELYSDGPVQKRCDDSDTVSGMEKIEYGTSVAQNGFACVLEQNEGFICWNEESGKGFQIQKRWDRTF